MNEALSVKRGVSVRARQGIVDCDIHPRPANAEAVYRFLPRKWHDYATTVGGYGYSQYSAALSHPRVSPIGCRRDAWGPNGELPGSSLEWMREQHLDPMNVDYGILIPLNLGGAGQRNQDFGAALCQAQNDWQIADWLELEPRLRGSIQAPQNDAAEAVAEIERRAKDKRFVQLQMFPKGLEPLGRKRYWPIYEAASDLGLPIMTHVGGANGYPDHGGGWASFYMDEHNSLTLAGAPMIASLILEGVFERFPTLKFIMVEMSFTWVPSLMARLDRLYERHAAETPRLTRKPSEYLRDHFYFTTQPMDAPENGEHLRQVMEEIGWDNLMFSSDYPHWDTDDPAYAFPFAIDKENRTKLLSGNAKKIYGLD